MVSGYRALIPTTLVLIGLAATSAFGLKAPEADPARPGPYAYQLQARIPQLESVENGLIDPATGAYATLVNQKAGPYAGSAEQVARAYLADKSSRFALARGSSDLVLDAVQVVPGGSHVRLVQSISGVPIYRADMVVSLDASGAFVTAVASNYDAQVERGGLNTTATLSGAQAREIAIGSLRITGTLQFTGDTTEGLWIVRDEDIAGSTPHLAWRITVPVMQPLGDWEVFVDARDGQVLRLLDQSLYVDGSGSAFDPDPLTTAGATYNTPSGSYTDNSDANHATLAAQTFTRSLPGLTLVSGLYYLRGPWVYIDEFESPTSAPATSADPNGFVFTRNQQGFEDTNAYYHIDQNQRYIQSLGFNNIQHAPIHVDTHGLSGQDNSHFIPSTNKIAWGEGGVDDAEDADVLLHEYGHAIQESSRPGWGGGQQGSMGEGFGDYWSGSYSASISSFRDTWVFNWDGHNPFWTGRVLNGTGMYSTWGSGDIYTNGTSWASCLWLMRAEMGRTALDTDVLKHHFYQGTSATGAQAAAFLMQADKDLYQGLHAGTIENFFVLRGFFAASLYDVPALTHTALPDTVETVGPFPVTVTVTSVSAVVAGSVKVKVGTGGVYNQEVVLNPTGNPNEWGGEIPVQAASSSFDYYIIADNVATWRGASPRGAEYKHNTVYVNDTFADVADGDHRPSLSLSLLGANPVHGNAALNFSLSQAGPARLQLIDVSGRVVRTLVDGSMSAGPHAASWNGRDAAGRSLPSGLYFARLDAEGGSIVRRVLMVR
jgi:Zn-dependent metalloprotease